MTPRNSQNVLLSMRRCWRLSLLSAALCCSACQQAPPAEPTPEPQKPAAPTQPAIAPEQLQNWLDQAQRALANNQLTSPDDDNALDIYQQIIALDPEQPDALYGIQQIVETYIELALAAAARRQFATARSMLARGRLILPDHPSIKPTEQQIRLLSEAKRSRLTFDQNTLSEQPDHVVATLRDFAKGITGSCRFVISAKNDAQGRWLYRALRGSEGDRLRAQIQIQLPAAVERQCFEDTSASG